MTIQDLGSKITCIEHRFHKKMSFKCRHLCKSFDKLQLSVEPVASTVFSEDRPVDSCFIDFNRHSLAAEDPRVMTHMHIFAVSHICNNLCAKCRVGLTAIQRQGSGG